MINQGSDFLIYQFFNSRTDVFGPENFAPHGVNRPAVAVHNVVVLDDVFTGVKVKALDLFLGAFQTFGDNPAFFSIVDNSSFFSTLTVPSSTGWPFSCLALTSAAMARILPASVL